MPDHDKLTRGTVAGLAEEQKVHLASVAHAQVDITAKAIVRIEPADLAPALANARAALRQTQQARADLDNGRGAYQHTDAGRAVTDLAQAQAALSGTRWRAEHGTRWRDRHAATKEVASWAEREAEAKLRWKIHVSPEATDPYIEVARHHAVVEQLSLGLERQVAASRLASQLALYLQRAAGRLAARLDAHRDQLDRIPASRSLQPVPGRSRGLRVPGRRRPNASRQTPHLREVQL